MWAEWVSPETIDSRVWPRTAAIAERLWSPREVNEIDDMYRRLAVIELQLEELGLTHIKNQPMLLRRLARSEDISALETLVSIIEPVKEYRRYRLRPQTMLSPLTGLIDAARPDAKGARAFNTAVDELLAGVNARENAAKIRSMIEEWRSVEGDLQVTMDRSPALAEARQLASDLDNVSFADGVLDEHGGLAVRSRVAEFLDVVDNGGVAPCFDPRLDAIFGAGKHPDVELHFSTLR